MDAESLEFLIDYLATVLPITDDNPMGCDCEGRCDAVRHTRRWLEKHDFDVDVSVRWLERHNCICDCMIRLMMIIDVYAD
ncbi:MAG: hypothetical protein HZB53_20055 [Chloroflexi bacterium]|nr:hypothetical protein [Chloroflexota bacterium]